MMLVVLLAAAVAATPVENHPEQPKAVVPEDSKAAEAGANREGKCK